MSTTSVPPFIGGNRFRAAQQGTHSRLTRAGRQGGRRQEWDMSAMVFFFLAVPQVMLDPSSPTRDGTPALCS